MNFYRNALLQISDFLTKPRPLAFVRRLQYTLLGLTLILSTFILSYSGLVQPELDLSASGPWAAGKNAPENVVAVHTIELQRMDQFELARKEAAQKAPLQFVRDFGVIAGQQKDGEKNFRDYLAEDMAALAACRKEPDFRVCIRSKIPRWYRIRDPSLFTLVRFDNAKIQEMMSRAVNIAFPKYVILKERVLEPEFTGNVIGVQDINTGSETVKNTLPLDSVMLRDRLGSLEEVKRLDDLYAERLKMQDTLLRDALVQGAVMYLYSINGSRFSKTETEVARKAAMERVAIPILRINRGDAIVQKDEVVTDEKYQALLRHKKARFAERIERIVAIFIEQAVLTGLLVYFAVRFALRRVSDVSSNLIIFVTVWAFAGVLLVLEGLWSNHVDYNEVTHYLGSWVPIGAFAVLFAIIFGDALAVPLAVYLAFLVFLASKNDGNSLIITAGVGVIGAIMGGRISKRVHFITTAVSLSLMGMVLTTACYLYGDRAIFATLSSNEFFSQNFRDALRISFFSGISTVLVIALLPVYETLFNIPTRFRLAELADPTNPLLKEMFRKAPSTWQHTLMVAALVEKACERLGLNTTLARTGIYYHDIGKMKNAGFFVENQHLIPRPENIDLNNPQHAAKVIIDHVLDGIVMAKAARLPREVLAFIPEHHGTSTMSFFYHKALEKMKRRVRREDFRYPGPLPQSKETGIAMIADSLEAASRSLDDFTTAAVDGLIAKIISLKLAENQLDESGLTLGDLSIIHGAFRDVLMSSYHFRPKYPDKKKTDMLERNQGSKGRRSGPTKAGRAPSSQKR